MNLHPTPETEQAIEQLIAAGFGEDPDEVIRRLALEKLAASVQGEEPRELPFEKAALFLHVSQERLEGLLDAQRLPCRQAGGTRFLPLDALKVLQREIKEERHRLQDQTVAMEQGLGVYE